MPMENDRRIHIATSGWYYEHWRGTFYPEDLPKKGFLSYYSRRFSTVEINSTFYGLPDEKRLKDWSRAVPEGFIFSVKASRFITHNKKLKDPRSTLPPFLSRIDVLGVKLGPVLFQLPPSWNLNVERLEEFLAALPQGYRYAFEFRDTAWFDERVYRALEKRGAAFCVYDFNGVLSPKRLTAGFAYIRLHGPAGKYMGKYSEEALSGWADLITAWAGEGRAIYCYFDNDEVGYAAMDAIRLDEIVRSRAAPEGKS